MIWWLSKSFIRFWKLFITILTIHMQLPVTYIGLCRLLLGISWRFKVSIIFFSLPLLVQCSHPISLPYHILPYVCFAIQVENKLEPKMNCSNINMHCQRIFIVQRMFWLWKICETMMYLYFLIWATTMGNACHTYLKW